MKNKGLLNGNDKAGLFILKGGIKFVIIFSISGHLCEYINIV